MDPIQVDPHPLLVPGIFATVHPAPLSETTVPEALTALLALDAETPLDRDEETRATVRDLFRHGGYKPTGRGKPASEYLVRAATEGTLGSINLAVDACNVVSLHSGLPISVVDADRLAPPLRIGLGAEGESYVFNRSGQEIGVSGLLCLFDAEGPCANGVKDSQRTKTHDGTVHTVSIVWGTSALGDRTERATEWYRRLLADAGCRTEAVATC